MVRDGESGSRERGAHAEEGGADECTDSIGVLARCSLCRVSEW